MTEQGAAEEILYGGSSMLEKKVLLLQRQLRHKVWSEYEGHPHPLKESAISHARIVQTGFCTLFSENLLFLIDRKTYLTRGRLWQYAHDPMHKFFCSLHERCRCSSSILKSEYLIARNYWKTQGFLCISVLLQCTIISRRNTFDASKKPGAPENAQLWLYLRVLPLR